MKLIRSHCFQQIAILVALYGFSAFALSLAR